jgi:hypothetical protein
MSHDRLDCLPPIQEGVVRISIAAGDGFDVILEAPMDKVTCSDPETGCEVSVSRHVPDIQSYSSVNDGVVQNLMLQHICMDTLSTVSIYRDGRIHSVGHGFYHKIWNIFEPGHLVATVITFIYPQLDKSVIERGTHAPAGPVTRSMACKQQQQKPL